MDAAFSNGIDSYLKNKFFMPLSPNWRNYPKIIKKKRPRFLLRQIKESIGYKAILQYTLTLIKALRTVRLLNAALYEGVDIALILLMWKSNMILCICRSKVTQI